MPVPSRRSTKGNQTNEGRTGLAVTELYKRRKKTHANPWLATVTSGLFNRLDLVAAEFRHEVSE